MFLHGKNELVAVFGWPLIKKLACPKHVFHIIRSVLIWTLKDTFIFSEQGFILYLWLKNKQLNQKNTCTFQRRKNIFWDNKNYY